MFDSTEKHFAFTAQPVQFDPFKDRRARDIRNTLTDAFVHSVKSAHPDYYEQAALHWRAQKLASVCVVYIKKRCLQYAQILAQLRTCDHKNPLAATCRIWNAGLFFEVHAYLEPEWQNATGPNRVALKGLIQAAGAYYLLQSQHNRAAQRLAVRANSHLTSNRECLGWLANIDTLILNIGDLNRTPPTLICNFCD